VEQPDQSRRRDGVHAYSGDSWNRATMAITISAPIAVAVNDASDE
jgi:hypothetical protein